MTPILERHHSGLQGGRNRPDEAEVRSSIERQYFSTRNTRNGLAIDAGRTERTAMRGLATLSPEQRAENQAKARAARAAKTAARRRSLLRRDFADANEWDRLASQFGVRLPPWGEPPTTTVMERFLRQIGRSSTWYYAESGEKSLREFAQRNPTWPARAWAGIVLELHARALRVRP